MRLPRCTWCGERDDSLEEKEYIIKGPLGLSYKKVILHVHSNHKPQLDFYLKRYNQYSFLFVACMSALTIAFLVANAIGVYLGADVTLYNGIVATAMGLSLFFFPFATPTTTALLGVRLSRKIIRVSGGCISVGAFFTILMNEIL